MTCERIEISALSSRAARSTDSSLKRGVALCFKAL
jgi:hypothetical protein